MKNPDVKKMFETIATGYDFQNRFLSLRVDTWWRKKMVENIQERNGGRVLDVATGTAEIALEIAKQRPALQVVGVDFSPGMLRVGMNKIAKRGIGDKIQLLTGDATKLPLKGSRFDAVTIAFGIRNIQEKEATLREFYAGLNPGGQLIIMEFGLPTTPVLGGLYRFYFNKILPWLGDTVSRTGYAYSYLANSVHKFPTNEEFIVMIGKAGFQEVTLKKLTFGIALLFLAKKL
jgi:demethylmenaquinone methyltransferase/2-methoxy-6-polyprenyl-1,4-benzoquinol methylase